MGTARMMRRVRQERWGRAKARGKRMAKATTDDPTTITATGMVTRDIAATRARPAGTAASSTIEGRGTSAEVGEGTNGETGETEGREGTVGTAGNGYLKEENGGSVATEEKGEIGVREGRGGNGGTGRRGRIGQLGVGIGNGEKAIARTLVEAIGAVGRGEMDGGRGAQNRQGSGSSG